jgi:hypothetical protein
MERINYQRQTIARNIGALKGVEAFQIGETILAWRPVTFTICDGNTFAPKVHQLQVKYLGNLIETESAYWEPACCGYPDDESLWSERQRQMVDLLCAAIGMVKI